MPWTQQMVRTSAVHRQLKLISFHYVIILFHGSSDGTRWLQLTSFMCTFVVGSVKHEHGTCYLQKEVCKNRIWRHCFDFTVRSCHMCVGVCVCVCVCTCVCAYVCVCAVCVCACVWYVCMCAVCVCVCAVCVCVCACVCACVCVRVWCVCVCVTNESGRLSIFLPSIQQRSLQWGDCPQLPLWHQHWLGRQQMEHSSWSDWSPGGRWRAQHPTGILR